jgi:IS30 family transposase
MAGRKKASIDWKRVDQMLMSQCSAVEIAATIGICTDTLYRACERDQKIGFAAYSQQKRAKGVSTAKEVFYQKAFIEKDTASAIFWMKNNADWSDKREVKQDITSNVQKVIFELPTNGTEPGTEPPMPPGWQANTSGSQPG